MRIQESAEMYLETIYVLSKGGGDVRSVDVSEHMGFSKPSVSRAVGLLKSGGYVSVDAVGHISLTEQGLEIAEKIYKRHNSLTRFFISLGVSEEQAALDACKIEHDISDEAFEAIERHIK